MSRSSMPLDALRGSVLKSVYIGDLNQDKTQPVLSPQS